MSNGTFNGVVLGCYVWLEVKTENEVQVHKIPRADGAIVRRLGGGLKTVIVHGWIVKNNRFEIEQYFDQLAGSLGSAGSDLIINGKTYSNCFLKSISPDSNHNNWATFTVTFTRPGD